MSSYPGSPGRASPQVLLAYRETTGVPSSPPAAEMSVIRRYVVEAAPSPPSSEISAYGEAAEAFPTHPSPADGASGGDITTPLSAVAQRHLTLDPVFYFDSISVVFEVEGYLIKVPTYLFTKESEYFTQLFDLPTQDSPEVASQPIILPADIRWEDFRNLLRALVPMSILGNFSLCQSHWVSVLNLSTKWHFDGVRRRAIHGLESLQSLPTLDKIILGRQCFVPSWYLAGLKEMVEMERGISHDEALTMDSHRLTAFKLSMLREKKLRARGYTPGLREIEGEFEDELHAIYMAAEKEGIRLSRPPGPQPEGVLTQPSSGVWW